MLKECCLNVGLLFFLALFITKMINGNENSTSLDAGPDKVNYILRDANATWPNDSCIEDTLDQWYELARTQFYQYSDLTADMFSSRLLYQTMFTMPFDNSSMIQYCQLYKSIRNQCDRCPNSPNKANIINGFSLADHMCIEGLPDYLSAVPCLANQDSSGAFLQCSSGNCSEYNASPYVYMNPVELSNENDTIYAMKMDCQYLQCDIDCRYPIIVRTCGKPAASFVLDSLTRTFQSISNGLKSDAQNKRLFAAFPEECRSLAQLYKSDTNVIRSSNITVGPPINADTAKISTQTRGPTTAITTVTSAITPKENGTPPNASIYGYTFVLVILFRVLRFG